VTPRRSSNSWARAASLRGKLAATSTWSVPSRIPPKTAPVRHSKSSRVYEAALTLVQARGDQVDCAWAMRGLTRVAQARGEYTRAWQ
jgi:hypothetical protein